MVILAVTAMLAGTTLRLDWRPLVRDGAWYMLSIAMLVAITQSLPLLGWFTLKLLRAKGVSFALLPHLYLFAAYEVCPLARGA